jgi:hypothetical protein
MVHYTKCGKLNPKVRPIVIIVDSALWRWLESRPCGMSIDTVL